MQSKITTLSAHGPFTYNSLSTRISSCALVIDLNVSIHLSASEYVEIKNKKLLFINSVLQNRKVNRIRLDIENEKMIELLSITNKVTMENLYFFMSEKFSTVRNNLGQRFMFTEKECQLIFKHLKKSLAKTFSFNLQTFKLTSGFINYFAEELRKLPSLTLSKIFLRIEKSTDLNNCGIESVEVLNTLSKFDRVEIDFSSMIPSKEFVSRTMVIGLKSLSIKINSLNVNFVLRFLSKNCASDVTIYFQPVKAFADILPVFILPKHGKQKIFCDSPIRRASKGEIKVILRHKESLYISKYYLPSWLSLKKDEINFLRTNGYLRK